MSNKEYTIYWSLVSKHHFFEGVLTREEYEWIENLDQETEICFGDNADYCLGDIAFEYDQEWVDIFVKRGRGEFLLVKYLQDFGYIHE